MRDLWYRTIFPIWRMYLVELCVKAPYLNQDFEDEFDWKEVIINKATISDTLNYKR